MVILDIFTKSVKVTYKSTLVSKATFLTFLFGIITVVLPFIFAYQTKGFWIKRDVFYEQPEVRFKGEYVFLSTTNNPKLPIIVCSTLPYFQNKFDFMDTCSTTKAYENDKNFDGKIDEFSLSLQINLPKKTQLTSFSVIVPLDYKLHECHLQMEAAFIYQSFLPIPLMKFTLTSELCVTQSVPLVCKRQINSSYNFSLIDENVENLFDLMGNYANRNISTSLKNIYTNFSPGFSQNFVLEASVKYPEDQFIYKPNFWQVLKWAWIQYLSIYIIVWCIITNIKSYIFSRKLVLFYEDNPIKKKQ